MSTRYTKLELTAMREGFESGKTLPELAGVLSRSAYGIASKMIELVEVSPSEWNPQRVAEYTRAEMRRHRGNVKAQKQRYRQRHPRKRGILCRLPEEVKARINWDNFRGYLADLTRERGQKTVLAERLSVHPSSITLYLSGKRIPAVPVLKALAKLSGRSYHDFKEALYK